MWRGIAYMVIAIALLSSMDAVAKWLTTHGVTVIQLLALRSVIIIPLMLAVFSYRKQLEQLRPRNHRSHLLRGVIGFAAPLCFFMGISRIPLTDAVALFFSSIFIITILSVVFLSERVGAHRWASIFAGFIGVLIVAGPQGGGQLDGYLLVLLGSTSYAILFVSGRYLSATESVASLVFSYNLCVGCISLLLLPAHWAPLLLDQLFLVILVALLAVSGHYLITMAFARSEASLIAPFEYTGVLWAIGFDLLIWQYNPTLTTLTGALIIIGSGIYITHREHLHTSR